MYARLKSNPNVIGDVVMRSSSQVVVCLHNSQKQVVWRLDKVEFIEHGSFNPDNDNYVEGGKVLE